MIVVNVKRKADKMNIDNKEHVDIKIKELKRNYKCYDIIYNIKSNNVYTTLEQDLILQRDESGKWTAKMEMDGFKEEECADEAVLKLGRWMERMGKAILSGKNYDKISLDNLFIE
jgi:hypothetical protein